MNFNEKVHAFIAAKFYVHLTETFGDRGEKAFIHGTQYYAEQRGRRMAQKAIRDGQELTYDVYSQYGEWVNTDYTIENEWSNVNEIKQLSPDFEIEVSRCPWHEQFVEMGLANTAGHEYCAHLDPSICRGFNPYIVYDVPETLHRGTKCTHLIRNMNYEEMPSAPKKTEYLLGFDYHCAHSYWAYNEVTAAIFGAEGELVNAAVMSDFIEEYGIEMANVIQKHKYTNFGVTPN